jgi:DNA-binding transcriptional LysR family regulator
MDYNDIPVFIRVVETTSFTRAAEALGVQKSSVSRSIVRLERELGVRLLQRTTRQLGLTDAGQTFYERVRGALSGFDEAATTVRELGSDPRGTIRMTAPPNACEFGLAEAVASFTRQYPSVVIELEASPRTVDLVGEGFDIALRAGRLADSSLIAKKVGTTDLVLFASPAYLKQRGKPRSPRDLAEHDCILARGRGGHASWVLVAGDREETVDVRGSVHSDEFAFALRAAIAGAGIATLPPQIGRDPYLRGELEVALDGYHMAGRDLHVVLPSSAFVPARVMLFRDHLVRELGAVANAAQAECTEHKRKAVTPASPRVAALPRKRATSQRAR